MTSKTLIVALAMLLTATSASMAWTHRHMTRHHGVYNYSGSMYHHSSSARNTDGVWQKPK